jgi:hypothetical protein
MSKRKIDQVDNIVDEDNDDDDDRSALTSNSDADDDDDDESSSTLPSSKDRLSLGGSAGYDLKTLPKLRHKDRVFILKGLLFCVCVAFKLFFNFLQKSNPTHRC